MKPIIIPILIILVLGFTSACMALPSDETDFSPKEGDSKYIPGKIYVQLSEGQSVTYEDDANRAINRIESENPDLTKSSNVKKLFNAYPEFKNYDLKKQFGMDRWVVIEMPNDADVIEESRKWARLAEVESAEPVVRARLTKIPNDPDLELQWQHNNRGENPPGTVDADMDTLEAWDIEEGSEILVATTEFVEWYHEDLVDNIWQNLNEDADRDGRVLEWDENLGRYIFDPDDVDGQDGTEWNNYQGNGYADDFIGWNFLDNNNNPSSESSQDGHGTATSGCMAATTNNSIGVAGTCWNCKLVAISSLNDFVDEQGIEYAVDNGVKVISRSFHSGAAAALVNYGESQGTIFISAAGNDHSPEVNVACTNEKVLCVSATDPDDKLASFTSYGAEVDIGAPGIYVQTLTHSNGYTSFGGTSASTPLVSGIVALIKSKNPELSNQEIISIVQSSSDPFNNPPHYAGNGRINANLALKLTERSAKYGSFPVAIIDVKGTGMQDGSLVINGTAKSPNFSHYELWGSSPNPSISKPRLIARGYAEIEDGTLGIMDGTLPRLINTSVTLKVFDRNRQIATDTYKKEDVGVVLSKKFSERGVEENGNRQYDYLAVNTSAYSSEGGEYQVLSFLNFNGGMETADMIYETVYLEPGMNDIEIKFTGYKIYHTETDGPYSVPEFHLSAGGDISDNFLGDFQTRNYHYTHFENIDYYDPYFFFTNGVEGGGSILRYLEINNSIIEDYFRWAFGSIQATMQEVADVTIATHQILDEHGNVEFFGTKFKDSEYEEFMNVTSHYEIYHPEEPHIGKLRLYSIMVNQPNWEFDGSEVGVKIRYDDFQGNKNMKWKIYSCEDYDYEEMSCAETWREVPSNATIIEGNMTSLSINAETEFREAFALGYKVGKPSDLPNVMEMSDILDDPL
jgi:hypothetical protein